MRKAYALILFGFLILSSFIILVSAQGFLENLNQALSGTLSDEAKGALSKILLMALVAMLVYGISDVLPFIDSEGVKWGIAIVVAILSFLFVDIGTIKAIVANYEALGVALTSVFPLIIIVFFSLRFEEKMSEKGPERMVYAKLFDTIIFIVFGLYLLGRIMFPIPGTSGFIYMYLISLVILLIWAIQAKKITLRFVGEAREKAEAHTAAKTTKRAISGARNLAAVQTGLGQGPISSESEASKYSSKY